jgi:beta-galactosidase
LRDDRLYGDPNKHQPLTFTECVGNFTGPLGEYNIILKKQLGAQLNWTGHSPDQRADALNYQAFMVKQATESFRRLRPLNPRLSGLMPFTILFYNWSGIQSFEQMKPKPAMAQMAISYQPVLLSWELWTPQVYSGSCIHPIAHVINDAEDGLALKGARLRYQIISPSGHEVVDEEFKLPRVPYYGTWSKKLEVALSPKLPSGDYRLSGQILLNGRVISRNEESIFIAGNDWLPALGRNKASRQTQQARSSMPAVYDPAGRTSAALKKLGVQFEELTALSALPGARARSGGCLVIGEDSWDSTVPKTAARLKAFMANGGRILCLRQAPASFDTSWLPEPITFFTASANAPTYPPAGRPFSGNMNINPERPAHPVFQGIGRRRLALWSDYKNWDETKAGFPELYPVTAGFKCLNPEALAHTAVLADYDRGLEGIALCEMFSGKGSVILSGFDLVARCGLDPIADRMLLNLVRFASAADNHEPHPLVRNQIVWGNYASESGVITGPANGLVVNADWVRPATNPSAKPLTQEEGAWNTKPGDQFVPHGRRLLGPYGYSTASSLKDWTPDSKNAAGVFWARIPPGKTKVVTSVENRSSQPADFSVAINESAEPVKTTVGPRKIIQVSAPITADAANISVRYQGSKELILLTTSFE